MAFQMDTLLRTHREEHVLVLVSHTHIWNRGGNVSAKFGNEKEIVIEQERTMF